MDRSYHMSDHPMSDDHPRVTRGSWDRKNVGVESRGHVYQVGEWVFIT